MRRTSRRIVISKRKSPTRKKTVYVKSYCRRPPVAKWIRRELDRRDMPF